MTTKRICKFKRSIRIYDLLSTDVKRTFFRKNVHCMTRYILEEWGKASGIPIFKWRKKKFCKTYTGMLYSV